LVLVPPSLRPPLLLLLRLLLLLAEFTALELALAALLKLSRGYVDVVPHPVDTNLDLSEFQCEFGHLLATT